MAEINNEINHPLKSKNSQKSQSSKLIPLAIDKIQIGGEIGRRINITVYENLLELNIESDFLVPFRERNRTSGYVGLGKLIDCTVKFAVYTHDDKIQDLKEHLVTEVIKTQETDGYMGILIPASRLWGVYDIHEMSYLVQGLTNDFKYFGEEASLQAAVKLADYIISSWSSEASRIPGPSGKREKMYGVTTGLDSALLTIYEQTKKQKYLDFLVKFEQYKLPKWQAKIKMDAPGKEHMDDERHVYIYTALCVAQLQLYKLYPDPCLLKQTQHALDFLIPRGGLLISGSCCVNEAWNDSQVGSGRVSESCATAYLIRMLDYLLQLTGKSLFGDIMERAVYNALFAAQSPDGRKLRYFCPLEGERHYFYRDTYCCPNNFRRIIAELPGMVYYRSHNGLVINLYTQSTAEIDLGRGKSVKICQETDYPNSGFVKILIIPSEVMPFSLQLRIPRWCREAELRINGETSIKISPEHNFYEICRTWNPRDLVTLEMPMSWRLIRGRKAQKGKAALMRGPVVYCIGFENNPEALNKCAVAGNLVVDPSSFNKPVLDVSTRPKGLKVSASAWPYQENENNVHIWDAVLTECTDPSSIVTYFHIPDITQAVEDELHIIKPTAINM